MKQVLVRNVGFYFFLYIFSVKSAKTVVLPGEIKQVWQKPQLEDDFSFSIWGKKVVCDCAPQKCWSIVNFRNAMSLLEFFETRL